MLSLLRVGNICRPRITTNSISRNVSKEYWEKIIGDREIVGPGQTTDPVYFDCELTPCPAIRFQPNSPYIQALKEKEKCDWRNLTIEEKKCLYRASFCQTFAEFRAPTGQWKTVLGFGLFFASIPIWIFMFIKSFVVNPLPETCTYEGISLMIRRFILLETGPIEGIASMWDYENWKWKDGYVNHYYNGEEGEFGLPGDTDD